MGGNDSIETFPIGRRLAFDARVGRLWVVCAHCERWNLSPIEERWEAVESCERLFREQKLRAQTDNIGLTRLADGTDLIRIGKPLRPEFAAWRYGGVFRRRFTRRVVMATGAGAAGVAGVLAVAGAPLMATLGPVLLAPLVHASIVATMVRGTIVTTKVIGEDGKVLRVTRADLDHSRLVIGDDGAPELHLKHSYGRQELTGDRATRALATLLASANRGGATKGTVRNAAEMIADAGDPARAIAVVAKEAERRTGDFESLAAEYTRAVPGKTLGESLRAQMDLQAKVRSKQRVWTNGLPLTNPGALHRLPSVYRLTLEMALHESSEQLALEGELAALERAWREAEEIGAIADKL